MDVGVADGFQHAGRRPGRVGALEAHAPDRHVVTQPDEVVLEAHLGSRRAQRARLGQRHPRAQRIVGHREEPHRDAPPVRQRGRDRAQRLAGAEPAGPEEVRGQVAVAQAEPVLAAQPRQLVHDRPALAGHAPSGVAVVHARQRVGDGVEVGADVQAVQHRVVAHVDDGRDVGPRDHAHEPGEHPSGPDAAAQGHQHAASIGAPGRPPFRPPLVPSPPAMPVRIPSDRHETVVSVLREAARVNGDVEAYVEPDGRGGRRALTFADWDRAADGVAGHLARRGVAKGDVVCLLLPSSIDYAVLYAGLLRIGAITSGINPRMGPGEVASILDRAAPVLLVLDPEAASPPSRDRGRRDPRRGAVMVGRGTARHLAAAGPGTRWRWSGPAGRRGGPRAPSSTMPTWPRWPAAPTS